MVEMLLGKFLNNARMPFNQIPLAFGKYKETHKAKDESLVGPCAAATSLLLVCIYYLGLAGDRKLKERDRNSYTFFI